MSVPTLDPREARPLTNREISKVLCSIIGGVVTSHPNLRTRVPHVLELAKAKSTNELLAKTVEASRTGMVAGDAWEVALVATVSGFRGWCDPKDVDSAVAWVEHHLPQILGTLAAKLPS